MPRDHPPADGTAIRFWRRKRGLKTGECAAAVRVSASHLRNVENGLRPASIELLNRLAEKLAVDLEKLLHAAEDAA